MTQITSILKNHPDFIKKSPASFVFHNVPLGWNVAAEFDACVRGLVSGVLFNHGFTSYNVLMKLTDEMTK